MRGDDFTENDLKCKSCANVATHFYDEPNCVERTEVPNCKTYDKEADTCNTCNDAYFKDGTACSLKPSNSNNSLAIHKGYIRSCAEYTDCAADFFAGLSAKLNAIFSCHKCTTSNKIPFAPIRGLTPYSAIDGLNKYSINVGANNLFQSGSGNHSVECLEPIPASFNLESLDNLFNFPDQCGLGLINTSLKPIAQDSNKQTGVDRSKIGVFCAACNPGYKAVGSTDNASSPVVVEHMVSRCDKIANCTSSTWFNYCSQCDTGYAYNYSALSGVMYDQCLQSFQNPYCFAYNSSTSKCVYCQKGYYLNPDNYCEKIDAPKCNTNEFSLNSEWTHKDISTALFLNNNGFGCRKCNDGFVGLETTTPKSMCSYSSFHQREKVISTSNFLYKCSKYKNQVNSFKCEQCSSGYILTTDSKCVEASGLPRCTEALNQTQCNKCESSFVLVNKACVAGQIEHCLVYENKLTNTSQRCEACIQGFYLFENTCKQGSITNCASYTTESRCSACEQGYTKIFNSNTDYCFPNPEGGCKAFDPDQFQLGFLKCTTC